MTTHREPKAPRTSMEEVRAIAARLRAGERIEVSPELLVRAQALLRHRAAYDARRAQVRALAAEVRAGRKPRAPADIMAAVERHLAYREWYNEDRRRKNEGGRKKNGRPTTR